MKKHLEKIRKKPEHERRVIARNLAIITTVVIVAIWLVLLSFGSKSTNDISDNKKPTFESFNNLIQQSVSGFEEIQAAFKNESETQKVPESEILNNEEINEIENYDR